MRIAMLCDMYKPHQSGVTNHIDLNKRSMETAGHEVFVLTFGDLDHIDEDRDVLRSPGIPWGRTGYRFGLGYSPAALDVLRSADIAHVHHPFMSGRFALRECVPRSIPIVFTNHTRYDLYSDAYAAFVPKAIRRAYVLGYLRRFCSRIDLTIAPSAGIAAWLGKSGVTGRIEVVPNSVDTRPFCEADRAAARAALGIGDDETVVCYHGRLGPEKDITTLLGCFGAASKRADSLTLLLVGDGPERARLETYARGTGLAGKVRFTGAIPYPKMPGVLAAADFAATASVTEVHPLTVIEAMATGLPVVGVVSPGVSDTVEDGATGLLVAPGDPVALAGAIERLASDTGLRAAMGARAREAAATYDVARTSAVVLERYAELVKAKRG